MLVEEKGDVMIKDTLPCSPARISCRLLCRIDEGRASGSSIAKSAGCQASQEEVGLSEIRS